ncbi:recombinase family protein [Celeribacter sp.]|uniref:recombinase family protein n=1 Tax=Celeribacter sp. TaxID=1890673 RepID=UPI003A92B82F
MYPEQIQTWRAACERANDREQAASRQIAKETKGDKKRIRELERELLRKEKALAETAALMLMVLRATGYSTWRRRDKSTHPGQRTFSMGAVHSGPAGYPEQACRLESMSGMTFEVETPHGRMMATMLAGIAQFERDLLSERVKSGLAAARARGKKLGRQPGQRPKSNKLAPKVVQAVADGRSYRWIARDLGISKNTMIDIMKRQRQNSL